MMSGDLVRLSAYGNNRSYNINLQSVSGKFRVGLVTKVIAWATYPYEVTWLQCDASYFPKSPKGNHSRRELKYAYHHRNRKSF